MIRSARVLASCAAVLTMSFAASCSDKATDADPNPDATSSPSDTFSQPPSYDMPADWPFPALPLPPGAAATNESVTADKVFFHVEGVAPKVAMAFYDEELPDLGLSRDTSAALDPVAYANSDMKVIVSSGSAGVATLMITRP